jgi:diguanylate cyclase
MNFWLNLSHSFHASTITVLHYCRSRLAVWHDEHNQVAENATHENLRRLPWILAAFIPLLVLGMIVKWSEQKSPDIAYAAFARLFFWVDVGLILWLSFLISVLYVYKRHDHVLALGRSMTILVSINFLLLGVTMSALSQCALPSATMYVLGCIFSGALLLIRPRVVVPIHAISYVFFFHAIDLWNGVPHGYIVFERLYGFVACVIGIFLSLLLWRWFTTNELLHREVEQHRNELEFCNSDLTRQHALLEEMAQHDALTGLLNRRAFEQEADLAMQRARRDGSCISVMMLDLDFFKHVNDHYGHPAGDDVLQFMASVLHCSVRDTDVVARVGGEEFSVLLPHTSAADACEVAEKIRLRVSYAPVPVVDNRTVSMTVSVGVAEFLAGHIGAFSCLYAAADQALYKAKQCGRNRVEVSTTAL